MTNRPEVPSIYAADLRDVVSFLDWLGSYDPHGDMLIENGTKIVLGSKNDYLIGTLIFEDGQWKFTPYASWAVDA